MSDAGNAVQFNYPPPPQRVVIVDFQMPFLSMVVFMLKWTLAAIPAALILFMLAALAAGFLGSMFSR